MNAAGSAAVVRRDRAIVIAAATLTCAIAWATLLAHARGGSAAGDGMAGHAHTVRALAPSVLEPAGAALAAASAMWFLMMVAMMLPAVAPWIILFAALDRRRASGTPHLPAALFAAGYFAVWAAYAFAAAAAQVALQQAALLDGHLAVGTIAGGALLVIAGLFQFTPLKATCLTHCRSPLGYLLDRWRDGPAGAFGLGVRHGAFCTGCCWALMALGFALGVMNLVWMAALTVVIVIEKNAPGGPVWARAFGVALIGWGGWLIAAGPH